MRVIVTGSTKWTDIDAIRRELAALPAGSVVIVGDCEGVDTLAREVARELGFTVETYEKAAEDAHLGIETAWKRLNERMVAMGVDLVLAFHPDLHVPGKARGSNHMLTLAKRQHSETRGFER